ncbi:YheC/YheD family protein [Paenibacillus glucanolyticus]|uniref:YheC/YheD family protein n=1 Tax=Paenibacillus glucanolyticus TaxID=59843 RepID=UPI00128C9079|nr:YheC/YheD family protein [Paenibacillus glucanolyticus]MPY18962.1 YheC/YheD family protein [Paenibacillus glucanolyticus]
MKYKSSTIKSKWKKTQWLLEDSYFRKYVPVTLTFNKKKLSTMLGDYSNVYFKPTGGSGGNNIIRIRKTDGGYQTQLNTKKTTYSSSSELYRELNRFAGKRPYLLQKGIRLAKSKGKPFDIRVMVQKTSQGKWVSTVLFTKIGSPGKVATNYNQGGSIGTFHKTMSGAGFNSAFIQKAESELKEVGVATGYNFDRHYRGFKELGLDVAIDSSGRPWILEVNTRPQVYPLKNLKDRSLYKRVLSYGKQYGRFK